MQERAAAVEPQSRVTDAAAAETAAVVEAMGPIADQLGSRGTVAQYEADIGDPARTRRGTTFADHSGPLPRFLPMRDIVRISFNILNAVPGSAIMHRLAHSTRIPTDDNLANCLPYAPTLGDALALGVEYGNATLPWFHRRMVDVGDELQLRYSLVAPLGRLEPVTMELMLVSTHKVIETIVGQRVAGARINCAVPTVTAPALLAQQLGCPVSVGGDYSCMAIPKAWCDLPSPYFDAALWAEGEARCRADIQALQSSPMICRVRDDVRQRVKAANPATVDKTAAALGVSARSLVRALALAGTTHHAIVESERRQAARLLLAQPLLKLAVVAERLGFPDQSSFGRKCRAWFGETPAQMRQRIVAGQLP